MPKTVYIWGVGWLGFPLAEYLNKNNFLVHGISRNNEKIEFLNSIQIPSLTIEEFISNAPLKQNLSGVLIITIPPILDPLFLEKLRLILHSLSPDSHVVYTSSIGLYLNKNDKVDENSSIDTNHALYIIENIVKTENPLRHTILRLGGLIGPKRHPVHYLVKKTENTNPNQVVNLIHQKDIIEIIRKIIDSNTYGIFNVCSEEHPTREDYYKKAALAFGYNEILFQKDFWESGKIIAVEKLKKKFPKIELTSIYDFEKCK